MIADPQTFDRMKENAKRDDWHERFVGSDIRQLIAEIERLRAALEMIRRCDDCDGNYRVECAFKDANQQTGQKA